MLLIERHLPLQRLRALAARAAEGAGSCVVVEGGAGIGKTALLRAVREGAEVQGLRCLWATGADLEREHAFGIARQLLAPAWRAMGDDERGALQGSAAALALPLVGAPPSGPAAAAPSETQSIFYGTYWLLAGLAERTPLVVIVDDAQWSDEPSLALLEYLARRVHDLPLLIVIATRPGAPGEDALVHVGEMLRLAPLSVDGVSEVAAALIDAGDAERLAVACHAATGGNPLYVHAVLAELQGRDLDTSAASAVAELGPEPVARSVDRRLAALPASASRIAEALVILGDDANLLAVAELADAEPEDAAACADALARAGILAGGSRLAFAHPVVRATVMRRLGEHDQALRHARAAVQRIARGEDPEVIARHVLRAPAGMVDGASAVLVRAAEAAGGRGAPAVAAQFLRRAADEPCTPEARLSALLALGDAQSRALDPAALATLAEAQTLATTPDARAEIVISRALLLYRRGEGPRAAGELEERLLAGSLSAEATLRVQSALLTLANLDLSVRVALRGRLGPSMDALRSAGGAPATLVLAHEAVTACLEYDDAEAAGALAEQALRACLDTLERAPGAQPVHESLLGLLVVFLDSAERWDALAELCDRALAHASRTGNAGTYAHVGMTYSWSLLRQGAVEDAARLVQAVHDQGASTVPWMGVWVAGIGRAVAAELEPTDGEAPPDPVGAEPRLNESAIPPAELALLAILRGKLRIASGDIETGLTDLVHGGTALGALGSPAGNYHWRSDAALALGRLGRLAEGREYAREELRLNVGWGAARAVGVSRRAMALLADTDEARARELRDAAATFDGAGAPLEHAWTLVALGAALRRQGRRADARAPLRQAIELADACHPRTRVAAQARVELAASGGRAPRTSADGVAALTASERRIVDLALQGLSNPQVAQELYISRRTVESHLARAYSKLGIAGRGELGRVLEPMR